MITLTDFLLARIAEDERCAPSCWPILPEGSNRVVSREYVLAACEAKRRIIEWVTRAQRYAAEGQPGAFDPEDARALTHALRLLALPYAGHPDYDDEWRP